MLFRSRERERERERDKNTYLNNNTTVVIFNAELNSRLGKMISRVDTRRTKIPKIKERERERERENERERERERKRKREREREKERERERKGKREREIGRAACRERVKDSGSGGS